MKKYIIFLSCILFLVLSLASCRSKKKVVYFQGNENYSPPAQLVNYEATIQPDDIVQIIVTSANSEAATPFNQNFKAATVTTASNNIQTQGYLVDKEGNIEFPVLGKIKIGGYTRTALIAIMKEKLQPYLNDAVVNINIKNFKVTILGEVGNQGIVTTDGDRLTMLEAIAQSGDLTIQGLRKNILVIRDDQGKKSFHRVDITRADFVDSPFYYLKQNDVVYVEPRRSKYDATALGSYLSSTASIISLFLTVTLLIIRL